MTDGSKGFVIQNVVELVWSKAVGRTKAKNPELLKKAGSNDHSERRGQQTRLG